MRPAGAVPASAGTVRGCVALGGLFLFVLAVLALSGPGRIDIVDGQARYFVARSLVDHGDPAVRDTEYWFSVLPGRDGKQYSAYRFPQSLAGVPAILLADATGPVSENRRQFFFSLIGAFVGAALAVIYALWFRAQGHTRAAAIGWALAGIVCTPNWFYATSTFDDLLGAVFVVAAVCLAWWGRAARPLAGAALAGLALGLAFNAKQPLGIFVLPVLALALSGSRPWRIRIGAAALVLSGLAIGLAAYQGYEWYKFPPGTRDEHARILAAYVHAWPGNTLAGFCGLLVSPAAGVFWYCPAVVLGLAGLAQWRHREPWFCATLATAGGVFFAFVSTMTFYKGDPCWGPRYLTPVFAVLWLFVPTAAGACAPRVSALVLCLGMLVQLLGLSVDPHRLYVYHNLSSAFYFSQEWIHFEPTLGHLANRPRELCDVLEDLSDETIAFSPATLPTSAPPVVDEMDRGPAAVHKYRFLAAPRPWWISQRWLACADRPVALGATAVLLLGIAGLGLAVLIGGLRAAKSIPREVRR